MSEQTPCPVCTKTGLAVLPSRYSIVQQAFRAPEPGFGCPQVIGINAPGYKYIARILRQGFLYIFYEKNHLGRNKWQVYSISLEGKLHRQQDPASACYTGAAEVCSRCGSGSFNKDFFVIEQPDKCGTTWLAFSEHKWSEATVQRYQADAGLRTKRMQKIEPAQWLTAPRASNYQKILAIESNLDCIVEYEGGRTNDPVVYPELSKPDGSHDEHVLRASHAVFPWYMRNGVNSNLVRPHEGLLEHMQKASRNLEAAGSDQPHYFPMLVALWDAVGIARELNGRLNDLLGNAVRYQEERVLQMDAANAIANMEQIFKSRAVSAVERKVRDRAEFDNSHVQERTEYFIEKRLSPRERGILDEHGPLYDRYRAGEISWDAYVSERSRIIGRHVKPENMRWPVSLWLSVEERRQVIEDNFRMNDAARRRNTAATWEQMRTERLPGETAKALEDWEKDYRPLLDPDALGAFNRNHEAFRNAVVSEAEARVRPLVNWLEAPLFIDTLNDYDQTLIGDGVSFEEVVGTCTFGMTCTEAGTGKIDDWVVEAKATPTNLVWRALLLNQRDAMDEVNPLLAQALRDTRPLESAVGALIANLKALQRTADTFKKAQTVYNAIDDAAKAAAGNSTTSAFGVALRQSSSLGLDKVLVSFGERIYRALPTATRAMDALGEKFVQSFLLMRAGVEVGHVESLLRKEARSGGAARQHALREMRRLNAHVALQPMPQDVRELRQAWADFRNSGTDKSIRAIRDIRLALVVGLVEGANLAKLMKMSEGDARSYALIAASALGVAAAVADIASVPAKSLHGGDAWTFQRLKLLGGALAAVGAFVGGAVAFVDGSKEFKRQEWTMTTLYVLKSGVSVSSALATMGTTISYAAPLLERITGRQSVAVSARVIGTRTAAIVGARILMLSVGLWITVALVAIEVAIWFFTPTPLQHWCKRNAFGSLRLASSAYKTSEEQEEELGKAIEQMM